MPEFTIQRASRTQSLLRLAIAGASGSGKTMSMLRVAGGLARAIAERGTVARPADQMIGLVDTERSSAKLYADYQIPGGPVIAPFDTIDLTPPYTVERYIAAIRMFEHAGYPIIIVDQISHAWAGAGGLLEVLGQVAGRMGNDTFRAFDEITPKQNRFVDELLATNAHLLVSMRSKTAWTKEEYTDSRGNKKTRPKRIGMAPVQRAGTEYEFTSLLNLDTEGNLATCLKDRTGVFGAAEIGKLTEKHGQALSDWLFSGAPAEGGGKQPASLAESFEAFLAVRRGRIEHAKTIPDLQAAWSAARAEVKAFDIGAFQIKKGIEAIDAAKDERKTALAPAVEVPRQGGQPIAPDMAVLVEEQIHRSGVPLAEFLAAFEISRISQLDASKLVDARDWIDAQAVTAGSSR